MKITAQLTDDAILHELGFRLMRARLAQNLTQGMVADMAGISKRSLERLEAGQVATQLSGFLRVCRALGILDRFDTVVPEPVASPMDQLKLQGRQRRRASGSRKFSDSLGEKPWTWGDSK